MCRVYLPAGECDGQDQSTGEQDRTAAQHGSSRHLVRHLPELSPNPLQHHRPRPATGTRSSRDNRTGPSRGKAQNTACVQAEQSRAEHTRTSRAAHTHTHTSGFRLPGGAGSL